MSKQINVALIGNPNTGKTSVFNQLTGLNQKVGNYPGITVEKKEGVCKLPRGVKAHILDLPGTYSLNTTSLDESVAVELLLNKNDKNHPDVALVVSDVENLKRNLLLFTQIKDLKIPTILVINMADRMSRKGISIDISLLEEHLDAKIALVSTRKGTGIEELKELIAGFKNLSKKPIVDTTVIAPDYFDGLKSTFPNEDLYKLWLVITQDVNFMPIEKNLIKDASSFDTKSKSELKRLQQKETILRYQFINGILKETYKVDINAAKGFRAGLDKVLTHKVFGYLIFFLILLLIFQTIYGWSEYPMDMIDSFFASATEWVKNTLPAGVFTDLIAEGILAGIENWKERLITILVTPFTTCSARLPVYLIIIALVIPEGSFLGLSYKALILMLLYLLGFGAAILSAVVLNKILKIKSRSFFVVEMPNYKLPLPKNVAYTVLEKTKSFVLGAGKIILAISIILWFLGSFGISNNFKNAEQIVQQRIDTDGYSAFNQLDIATKLGQYQQELNDSISKNAYTIDKVAFTNAMAHKKTELLNLAKSQEIASFKLENSFMGYAGKVIEPIVKPLGYDWKIGIAVLTSFAAREVFVGTLATIYSVGSGEENTDTITQRMAAEVNPKTQKPVFNLATGISILLFYAFAMQCMSTLAVVKRETNSWKWPTGQLVFMSLFAYIIALIAYQLLK